jgi:hypothetical protein
VGEWRRENRAPVSFIALGERIPQATKTTESRQELAADFARSVVAAARELCCNRRREERGNPDRWVPVGSEWSRVSRGNGVGWRGEGFWWAEFGTEAQLGVQYPFSFISYFLFSLFKFNLNSDLIQTFWPFLTILYL